MSVPFDPRLAGVSLVAAIVQGALGYGFSSIVVPASLLFLSNRRLNPALVLVELAANAYALLINRHDAGSAWPTAAPLLLGLPLGIAAGAGALAAIDSTWAKLGTYVLLLPIIVLQLAGRDRPVRSFRTVGPAAGFGIGALYGATTISGPPLAIVLINQGLSGASFRAGMATLRTAESGLAVVAYAWLGLLSAGSLALVPSIVPAVLLGMPLGAWAVSRVPARAFRRMCLSLELWIASFGLASALAGVGALSPAAAAALVAAVLIADGRRLLRLRQLAVESPAPVRPPCPVSSRRR